MPGPDQEGTPLPEWEPGTPGVLVTAGTHAIPVSTATRAGDRLLVFALGRRRETLRLLRDEPEAAFCLLGAGVAFTAYGRARIVSEQLADVPVAALELEVERVQDHLADGRTAMIDGARWRWKDTGAAEADSKVVEQLARLAAGG
jgi:hypothetical protein